MYSSIPFTPKKLAPVDSPKKFFLLSLTLKNIIFGDMNINTNGILTVCSNNWHLAVFLQRYIYHSGKPPILWYAFFSTLHSQKFCLSL